MGRVRMEEGVCGGHAQGLPDVQLVLGQRGCSFLFQGDQHAGLGQGEALVWLADFLVESLPGPVHELWGTGIELETPL